MTPAPLSPPWPPRASRRAVSIIFFVNGMVLASWLPHIPAVKARHAISDGELGVVLLFMAVGALLALPLAGWLVARAGSRAVTSVAAIGLCAALPLPLLSPSVVLLSLSLVVLGACNATLDVAMNAQAVAVEAAYRRAIMSSFHGLFSLGGLAGAAVAGGLMAAGVGDLEHVTVTAIAALLAVACGVGRLVPDGERPAAAGARGAARPTRALVALGGFAFCGLLAEGAMGDWSAVYLHDTVGSSAAIAATGFAAFSLAMAAGRFGGDSLVARLGPAVVLRTSSAVAAVGLAAALAVGTPTAGIAGCGLVGLGISNVIPILFSAAGRVGSVDAGPALATVATTGYFGFLAGPPLIGLAAEATGLRAALAIVSMLCGVIVAGAGMVHEPGARTDGARTTGRAAA